MLVAAADDLGAAYDDLVAAVDAAGYWVDAMKGSPHPDVERHDRDMRDIGR